MLTRAYISAWADARGTVEVIDIERSRGFCTSINNATVVGGAYDPLVLTHDLEGEYGKIESRALPVVVKLCGEPSELTDGEMNAMIAFLDMHLDRGRYADQARTLVPAVLLKEGGVVEGVEFNAADRLRLSRSLSNVLRLDSLGIDRWEWRVQPWLYNVATGDGAVLLFEQNEGSGLCTVAFPLSPTKMLIIGKPLQLPIPINPIIASKCRRWIVGSPGTLRMGDLSDGTA